MVGSYSASGAAADDYKALKAGEGAGDYQVVAAVVLNRDANGMVDVAEHDSGAHVAAAARFSAAPRGSWSGCSRRRYSPRPRSDRIRRRKVGKLTKKHQQVQLGVEIEEYLPAEIPAVVAIVDDTYADQGRGGPLSTRTSGSTRQSTRTL